MTNSIVRTQALSIQRVDNGYIVHQQLEDVSNVGKQEGEFGSILGLQALSIRAKTAEPVVLVFTQYKDLVQFMENLGWP